MKITLPIPELSVLQNFVKKNIDLETKHPELLKSALRLLHSSKIENDISINNEVPVWKFNKVEIIRVGPRYISSHKKSTESCYATIDFGFFYVHDIGITLYGKDDLTWSQDFGWSKFKFSDSYIENPYGDEVRKLEVMIKNELDKKKKQIINYIKSNSCMGELLTNEEL